MDINKDYYFILGVAPTAKLVVIKASYRALTMLYHPDRNPDNKEAHLKTVELNEAYSVLSNESNRKEYDSARGSDTYSADDFINEGFDETSPKSDPLEEKWQFAIEYYPELIHLQSNLQKISWRLSNTFKAYVIEEKAFEKGGQVADELEKSFLENYFSSNKKLMQLAKSLILNKQKEAAKELNKAVVLFGNEVDADKVIKIIRNKFFLTNYTPEEILNNDLRQAVVSQDIEKVEYCLLAGADPNIETLGGTSLLGWAKSNHLQKIPKLLVQYGASY